MPANSRWDLIRRLRVKTASIAKMTEYCNVWKQCGRKWSWSILMPYYSTTPQKMRKKMVKFWICTPFAPTFQRNRLPSFSSSIVSEQVLSTLLYSSSRDWPICFELSYMADTSFHSTNSAFTWKKKNPGNPADCASTSSTTKSLSAIYVVGRRTPPGCLCPIIFDTVSLPVGRRTAHCD